MRNRPVIETTAVSAMNIVSLLLALLTAAVAASRNAAAMPNGGSWQMGGDLHVERETMPSPWPFLTVHERRAGSFGAEWARIDIIQRIVAVRAPPKLDRNVHEAAEGMKSFSISIDGSAGVQVVAACLVNWGDDIEVVTLRGEVPQTRKVEAAGLSCQIQKVGRAGRLVVEISKNGRVVSRNVSSGSSSVVSVSVQ
jgi:hypothetical protein